MSTLLEKPRKYTVKRHNANIRQYFTKIHSLASTKESGHADDFMPICSVICFVPGKVQFKVSGLRSFSTVLSLLVASHFIYYLRGDFLSAVTTTTG